jgi:hypothetical protein
MAQFTGGTARYLKRVKTGDYEYHEAEAVINWSSDGEDAEATMAEAEHQAVDQVFRMLGMGPSKVTFVDTGAQPYVNSSEPVPTAGIPPKMRRKAKDTPDPLADATAASPEETAPSTIAEITNDELKTLVNQTNERVENPLAIRTLIAEFAGPIPKKVYDIPQADRPAFVEALKAVPKLVVS